MNRRAVYRDGRVCISILHAPGDDPHAYESAGERWSPVQSVSIDDVTMVTKKNAQHFYSVILLVGTGREHPDVHHIYVIITE